MLSCDITLLYILLFFFFFSSRRRHTRSLCDWSSDVCSSDLATLVRRVSFSRHGGRSSTSIHRERGRHQRYTVGSSSDIGFERAPSQDGCREGNPSALCASSRAGPCGGHFPSFDDAGRTSLCMSGCASLLRGH